MANFTDEEIHEDAVQPCENPDFKDEKFHWIEVELAYEDNGDPVPGEEYCITLPDGAEVRGLLNQKGWARVNFIKDPGDCKITFPNLDKDTWKPA